MFSNKPRHSPPCRAVSFPPPTMSRDCTEHQLAWVLLSSTHGSRAGAAGIGSFATATAAPVGLARSQTCMLAASWVVPVSPQMHLDAAIRTLAWRDPRGSDQ